MTGDDRPSGSVDTGELFLSLAGLKAAHHSLLKRRRASDDSSVPAAAMRGFVEQGRETGVLLDDEEDRWAAQSLLDYWANALYRETGDAVEAELRDFDPTLAPELEDDLCPYVGLEAFAESDHGCFHGRGRLIDKLVDRLQGFGDDRLLTVVGPSGSGKSSVVLAGLIPRLKAGALAGSEGWTYLGPMVPGSDPLGNLVRAVLPVGSADENRVKEESEKLGASRHHLVRMIAALDVPSSVLIVDQFEEIFTLVGDSAVRKAFIGNLVELSRAPDRRDFVVLTMRSDFESYVAKIDELQPLFEAGQERMTPLSAGELREAIERPAQRIGLKFERGIVDELVNDILGEPAGLPLLQFTLLKLWEKRRRNRVSWEVYRGLGGCRDALANSAEELYQGLIPEEQKTAKRILLRLARPGAGVEITSNRIRRDSLYKAGEAPDRVDRVLERLVAARLLHLARGETGVEQVEVAHEALIRNWPRLLDWIEDERSTLRHRLRLTSAAEEWRDRGEDPSALLRGARLGDALEYDDLTRLEKRFVEESRRARDLAEAHEKRREQRVKTGLGVVALGGFALAAFAFWQWTQARDQRNQAVAVRLAAQALSIAERQPERLPVSTLIAAEAMRRYPSPEADRALRIGVGLLPELVSKIRLKGTRDVVFDSGGASLATAGWGGGIGVWRVGIGGELESEPHRRLEPEAFMRSVAFSPDGNRLAGAGWEETGDRTSIVGVASTRKDRALSRLVDCDGVSSVAFGSGGDLVAVACQDGVRILRSENGEVVQRLEHAGRNPPPIVATSFTPDGRYLITLARNRTLRIWDTVSWDTLVEERVAGVVTDVAVAVERSRGTGSGGESRASATLVATSYQEGHADVWSWDGRILRPVSRVVHKDWSINGVDFSDDASLLATAGGDGTARVWKVGSWREVVRAVHDNGVNAVALGGRGDLLATGTDEGLTIWRLGSGLEVVPPIRLDTTFGTVRLDRAGDHLLAVDGENRVSIWNLATGEAEVELVGDRRVGAVDLSPDGRLLAVAESAVAAEGEAAGEQLERVTVRDWATRTEQRSKEHEAEVQTVVFSPDSRWLASADAAGGVQVWSVSGTERDGPTIELGERAGIVRFSPEGERLLTASVSKNVRFWDLGDGMELWSLRHDEGGVQSVDFDRAGRWVATGTRGGVVRVVDRSDGGLVLRFPPEGQLQQGEHATQILQVRFSPDATHLAAAVQDGTARVWRLADGREVAALRHERAVNALAFRPGGGGLATAGNDRTAVVWELPSATPRSIIDHERQVREVFFRPSGEHLVTVSAGSIHVWYLEPADLIRKACERVGRDLTVDEWREHVGPEAYVTTCGRDAAAEDRAGG